MSTEQKGVQWVTIDPPHQGQRLDNYLLNHLKGVPRSRIYRLIRKGEIRINKKRCKPDRRLEAGDRIRIAPIRQSEAPAPVAPGPSLVRVLENSLLYEDEHLLVLNKPRGLAVHGGSGLSIGLIEALRFIRPQDSFMELVHRLDKDTSGCLLIARDRETLNHLHSALKGRQVEKTYQVLVHGHWAADRRQVEAPLRRNEVRSGERIVTVNADGKNSLTRFRLLETLPGASLIEATPVTGRTHQIRVHCQHAGHPVIGDPKYTHAHGHRFTDVRHLCLHAARISFRLPDGGGEERPFAAEAPLCEDMQTLLESLREGRKSPGKPA